MWKTNMQSSNKKDWKILELQIKQTRHPKSVADGQMDGRSEPTTRPAFAKATQVTIMINVINTRGPFELEIALLYEANHDRLH